MGNGFPGLAIVSVIALFVALAGTVLLLVLQLWATGSVTPTLSVAPGLGAAIGDSVAIASAPPAEVADAHVARGGHPALVAAPVVADEGGSAGRTVPTIAPAQAVARQEPAAPPAAVPKPSPQPQPQPQAPPPAATVVPVVVSAPTAGSPLQAPPAQSGAGFEGGLQGPVGAGAGPPLEEVPSGSVLIHEGGEYALSFSLQVEPTAYLAPEVENSIVQLSGETGGPSSFGLQLWDDGSGSQHGLWSSGEETGAKRFLAPLADGAVHELVIEFRASSEGDGFYLVLLDGQPVDAVAGVSLIGSGGDSAQIDVGLFREGERVEEPSGVVVGAVELEPLEPALP